VAPALQRFERVVVHSERGREQLCELVEPERLRVIPHPVFASRPERRDDGRTLLSLGIIREYKGLDDAIEATKRIDGARLLVAGDPLDSIDAYRAAAGRPRRVAPRLSLRGRDRRGPRRDDGRALPL
jgi:glycosyltransferase involved in cell wall biosynthesis